MSDNWRDYRDPFYGRVLLVMAVLTVTSMVAMYFFPSSRLLFAAWVASVATGVLAMVRGTLVAKQRMRQAKLTEMTAVNNR